MGLTDLLHVAKETAVSAGHLILEQRTQFELSSKGFRDVVTSADIAAQKLITEQIQATFPTHGFLTEEADSTLPQTGDVIWVIDPIDGTTNYSRQFPLYCVSVAAVDPQTHAPLAGAIYDPNRQELFTAMKGGGAKMNGRLLTPSHTDTLANCLIGFDWSRDPHMRQQMLKLASTIGQQVYTLRGIGSATLALAWIAAGRLDAYLNLTLKAWDVAVGRLILEEVGASITTPNNTPWHLDRIVKGCVASNGRLHNQLLPFLTS